MAFLEIIRGVKDEIVVILGKEDRARHEPGPAVFIYEIGVVAFHDRVIFISYPYEEVAVGRIYPDFLPGVLVDE